MDKIVVGPSCRGAVDIDAPVKDNLKNIARRLGRDIDDLTVMCLDRSRHKQLINDVRESGARIRLISDGDLSAGISAAVAGTNIHALMGIGGAPEGVITAAAMKCLNGEIQAKLVFDPERLGVDKSKVPPREVVMERLQINGNQRRGKDLRHERSRARQKNYFCRNRRNRRRIAARRSIFRRGQTHAFGRDDDRFEKYPFC